MKILYFHQYFKTRQGSGGTRSYEFAKYLVEKGHKLTMVYALSDKSTFLIEGDFKNGIRRGSFQGINLVEFNMVYSNKLSLIRRTFIFFRFSFKSIVLALTEDYDILFATSTPLTIGIPGIVMKIFRKKKFIFEVRDLWPELPREMGVIKNRFILLLMSLLEWLTYRMADACIGLSPGIVAGISKRRTRKGPVLMIPNASDIDLFTPGFESKSIFPGCTDNDFIAIFTGAHGIANGLDSVINAAKIIQNNGNNRIKFVFIGDGMQKNNLVDSVNKFGLNNCIFMNPVSRELLQKHMNAADIGLMILANIPAFYFGTSPNKFFDYLASGLPVLVNYPGWMSDLVTTNNCGVAVEPDSPESFAKKMIYLHDNRQILYQMRENSRKLAISDFDRTKLASEFEAVLINTFNEQENF